MAGRLMTRLRGATWGLLRAARGGTGGARGSLPGLTPVTPVTSSSTVRALSVVAAPDVSKARAENQDARMKLAASYRILEQLGLHEGICNHLSMMTSARDGSPDDVMLLVPYGLHWREVTASSLVGVNASREVVEGEGAPEVTAACIHQGVRNRHRHNCVFHVHSPYTTALGCLEDPTIELCHQTAMRFYNRVAYDTEFGGFGDNMEEGRRLGDKLGTDKDILMMGNHGMLAVGSTPGWALDCIYYMERLAMIQVLAMSTGKPLKLIPIDVAEDAQEYLECMPEAAELHFQSLVRLLQKDCPEFSK